MEPGIYSGLTHDDLPPGLSPSGAKTLAFGTPAEYQHKRQNPVPPSRAMILGTLVHGLVLEGTTRYIVCRDGHTKDGKADKERVETEGLTAVTAKEAEQIEGMAKSVLEHEFASAILGDGQPEQAVIWTDERTGIVCRGFIDWLRPDAIADLKTTQDASRGGFGKQAANLGYDIAEWMYREAIRQLTGDDLPFFHIAVESHPPYLAAVHEFPAEAESRGERLARRALDTYARCIETGDWPGYPTDHGIDTTRPKRAG